MIPGSANPLLLGQTDAGGFQIERSLRFNSGDSAYLNRTPSAAGNRKTFTWAGWVKRSAFDDSYLFSVPDSGGHCSFMFNGNTLKLNPLTAGYGSFTSNALFRDPSSFYHIVLAYDSTLSTAADRIKLYVNGAQQTFSSYSAPTQNIDTPINNTVAHYISKHAAASNYANLYLADVHFIDGQALAPTDFGETDDNGVWQPKKFAGTYGWFNNSQTWSSSVASTTVGTPLSGKGLAQMFNANIDNSESSYSYYESNSSNSTVAFSPALTSTDGSNVKMYISAYQAGDGQGVEINGSAYTLTGVPGSGSAPKLFDLGTQSLSSISWTAPGGTNLRLSNPVVDGKILIDSGVSVADNSFHLDFADNSSNAALGTDTSGNSNTWTVNNLTANDGAAPSKTLTRVRFKTDWNWMYVGQIKINGSALTTGTLDNPGDNTWSNIGGWKNGSTGSGNETYSRSARGEWFDVTLASSIASFSSLELFVYLDSSSGTTTNIFEIELFYSDGTSFTKAYAANSDAPNQASAAFNSRQWQNFTNLGVDPSNIDSLVDTPTNGNTASDTGAGGEITGCYATLNPLESALTGLNNGNLNSGASGASSWKIVTSTIGVSSGKYYWEGFTDTAANASAGWQWGVCNVSPASLTTPYGTGKWSYQEAYIYNQTSSSTAVGTTAIANDLLGYALDMDAGTLKLYVNNSLVHTFTGLTGTVTPFVGSYATPTMTVNFGQRAFAYAAPSGYKALCTANLPTPTIADGSKYFEALAYIGNGTDGRDVTGFSMSPDFVWIKGRTNMPDGYPYDHFLADTVRGAGKSLASNTTGIERTDDPHGYISQFNADGFRVTSGSTQDYYVNETNEPYITWAWDAGSSNTTIAVGSLNSSFYNQAQAWNSQVTGTSQSYDFGGGGLRGDNNWFDGDIKHASSALSGNTITWTGSIAFTSSFAIASDNDGADPSVSAPYNAVNITHGPSNTITNVRSQLPNTTNSQIAAGTIPLTVLTGITSPVTKIECVGGTQGANGLTQVVADGSMLVDSGITLANVPSIASTVRANPSAGFSIVTYTGTQTSAGNGTIGHGLNAQPALVISKDRDNATPWIVQNTSLGDNEYLILNTTNSVSNSSSAGAGSLPKPTSSVFYGSWLSGLNTNGADFVAYCFAPVEGYSAIGSYQGNGNADGPFVHTGFKVAWLMVKNTTTNGETWTIYDAARDPDNLAVHRLQPNESAAESTSPDARNKDLLSNGFKVRGTSGEQNTNGNNYLYLAFASNPFASNGGLAR